MQVRWQQAACLDGIRIRSAQPLPLYEHTSIPAQLKPGKLDSSAASRFASAASRSASAGCGFHLVHVQAKLCAVLEGPWGAAPCPLTWVLVVVCAGLPLMRIGLHIQEGAECMRHLSVACAEVGGGLSSMAGQDRLAAVNTCATSESVPLGMGGISSGTS